MKCNECNGTGQYFGLAAAETCRACSGTGEVQVPDALPLDLNIDTRVHHGGKVPLTPMEGERIYFYGEDVEGTISAVNHHNQSFEARFASGRGRGSFRDIAWNITANRWEILRT